MSETKLAARPQAYRQELLRVSDVDFERLEEIREASKNFINDSMQTLRDWYNKQPHFPKDTIDDYTLLRHLVCNKFSIEKTKTKIENLLTARSMVPDFFSIRDATHPRIDGILNKVDWVIFPEPTVERYRVIYIRLKPGYDHQNFDASMLYTLTIMLGDILHAIDAVRGDIHIWDCANSSLGLMANFPPSIIKKSAVIMQQCYGHRIKGIHILHVPQFAEFAFGLMKGYLPKKISDRVFFHNQVESLYQYIPRKHFPKDMGGEEPKTTSEIAEIWKKAMRSSEWRQWFRDTETLRTDESRRPVKNINNAIHEEFGVCGSFRKLDLD